jgi:putative hemolysin
MTESFEPIQWSSVDVVLLVSLLPLLLLSAFFSCSETALFRLSQAELGELRKRNTSPAKAALYLVKKRRTVLITILIGNMSANVLYFIVSSVLILHVTNNVVAEIVIAFGTLFSIIIFGEILPKMTATARPTGISSLIAPPLLIIHSAVSPLRKTVDFLIITPLSRLATTATPEPLNAEELATLVNLSKTKGIIDQNEQQALFEVVELSRIRVREAMTPRVHMIASASSSSSDEIREVISKTRLTQLPIYGDDMDDIVGMLHTKRYLQQSVDGPAMMQACMTRPQFIPQVATLDQLLSRFRETSTRLAIVVDEFGGTAGLVTLEDVLEELVGEIGDNPLQNIAQPKKIGEGKWLIDANTGVRAWAAATNLFLDRCPAATMGGLIAAQLGRIPSIGDSVELGNLSIEVHTMEEYRVATVIVSLCNGEDKS